MRWFFLLNAIGVLCVAGALVHGQTLIPIMSPAIKVGTVSALPVCTAPLEGMRRGVSDALLPVYLANIVGGGSGHVDVRCNGSAWVAE